MFVGSNFQQLRDDIKKSMKDKKLNSNSLGVEGSKLLQVLFNWHWFYKYPFWSINFSQIKLKEGVGGSVKKLYELSFLSYIELLMSSLRKTSCWLIFKFLVLHAYINNISFPGSPVPTKSLKIGIKPTIMKLQY